MGEHGESVRCGAKRPVQLANHTPRRAHVQMSNGSQRCVSTTEKLYTTVAMRGITTESTSAVRTLVQYSCMALCSLATTSSEETGAFDYRQECSFAYPLKDFFGHQQGAVHKTAVSSTILPTL